MGAVITQNAATPGGSSIPPVQVPGSSSTTTNLAPLTTPETATNQLGPNASQAAITPQTAADLISSITNATTEFGAAQSAKDLAAGDVAEEGAYSNAGAIATANSRLAQVSGQVQQYQQGLQIQKTIGTQQADVAGNGFAGSGTALSLLRSSTQQGLLAQQITGVNADLQAGGYAEQAAASAAEQAAAAGAATSQTDLSANLNTIATTSKTNAINEASALGLNIPGISNISATSMPAINPTTLSQYQTQAGGGNTALTESLQSQGLTPGIGSQPGLIQSEKVY